MCIRDSIHGDNVGSRGEDVDPFGFDGVARHIVSDDGGVKALVICYAGGEPRTLEAVSYTHLDVYKRQL